MHIEPIDIFTQIPTYIFWKDVHSRFLGCNKHFAAAAGLTSEKEIIGKTDFDLPWCDTSADLYQQGDKEVLDGKIVQNKVEPQLQADGKNINILINKLPLFNNQGQKIGIIGSYMEMRPTPHGTINLASKNISLSPQQINCLALLAKGMTAKQIGLELNISSRTVEAYIQFLKVKLSVSTKAALIQIAWSTDFIKARILELS